MDTLNLTGTMEIETSRLILRRFTPDDAEDMYANWAGDPEVTKFLMWDAHTDAAATHSLLEQWAQAYADPRTFLWAIVLKETGKPIGSISLLNFNEQDRKAEVGYCIGRRWWGKGLMAEALRAVLTFAFDTVGLNRVEACHDTRNIASGRVMQKAGMEREGHFRQWKYRKGRFCDFEFYAILKEDFSKC
jgi:[ribosomal protein S5]-alanine N-acetyltransferase